MRAPCMKSLLCWSCVALAVLCAGLGSWSSIVTLKYFEHGVLALETDAAARNLAAGCAPLLVVIEMFAFAVAAVLPRQRLQAQRWALVVLAGATLSFECVTIILVQHGITQTAEAAAQAQQARVHALQVSIAALRATAEELRDAAAASSQSKLLASRLSAAESLAAALDTERQVEAHSAELVALQAGLRPTATQILGERGALAYAVARGLLVSVAGLVLFGVSGALLRRARELAGVAPAAADPIPGQPSASPAPAPLIPPAAAPAPEAVPLALSIAPDAAAPDMSAVEVADLPAQPAQPAQHEERFQRALSAVRSGLLKPTTRAVRDAVRCSNQAAGQILGRMVEEGVLRRAGQGYVRGG